MSVNRTSLGKRISFYRSKSNLTQEVLAAKVNCSREYINSFYNFSCLYTVLFILHQNIDFFSAQPCNYISIIAFIRFIAIYHKYRTRLHTITKNESNSYKHKNNRCHPNSIIGKCCRQNTLPALSALSAHFGRYVPAVPRRSGFACKGCPPLWPKICS